MPRGRARRTAKLRVPRASKPPQMVIAWWYEGEEEEIDLRVLAGRVEIGAELEEHERDFLADFLRRGGRLASARERAKFRGQLVAQHVAILEAFGHQTKYAISKAMELFGVSRSQAFEMVRKNRFELDGLKAAIAEALAQASKSEVAAPDLQPSLNAAESGG